MPVVSVAALVSKPATGRLMDRCSSAQSRTRKSWPGPASEGSIGGQPRKRKIKIKKDKKKNKKNLSWKRKFPQEQSEGLGGPQLPRPSKTSPKM